MSTDKLSSWVSWITRPIGYGIVAVIILVLLFIIGNFGVSKNIKECLQEEPTLFSNNVTGLQRTQAMAACLKRKNGFLENYLTRSTQDMLQSLPNAPSEYVGVWHSSHSYRITLLPNSEYIAEPLSSAGYSPILVGSWGVYKNQMVWMDHTLGMWPPDINIIINKNSNSFSLIERDGSQTEFTRVETGQYIE